MPALDSLPPILQVVATMAVIVLGGGIAFYQFSSKWLGRFAPKPKATPLPTTTTDAVVVSAAFADGKPLRELVECVKELNGLMANLRSCTRDQTAEQARTTDAVARLSERVGRVGDLLDDRLPNARGDH